jgi:hypothetical protein
MYEKRKILYALRANLPQKCEGFLSRRIKSPASEIKGGVACFTN